MFEVACQLRSEESSEINGNVPAIPSEMSATGHKIYSLFLSGRSHHSRTVSGFGLV